MRRWKVGLCTFHVLLFFTFSLLPAARLVRADDREQAARALYQDGLFEETANGDVEAAIELYRRVVEEYDDQPVMAARALFRIGTLQALRGDLQAAKSSLSSLLERYSGRLLDDPVLESTRAEMEALERRVERDRKEKKVQELMRSLRGLSWKKKMEIIDRVTESAESDYLPILHDLLDDEEDPRVQIRSLEGIEKLGDRSSFRYLFEALSSKKPQVAMRAQAVLDALGNRMASVAPGELVGGLSSRDPNERYHLIKLLRDLPEDRLVPELLQRLDAPDPQLRYYVLILLGNHGSKSCVPRLAERLDDPYPENRMVCAVALKKLGDEAGLPVLHDLLRHRAEHIRVSAAHTLVRFWNDPRGTRILVQELSSPFPDHRTRAIESLEALHGTRMGYDPEAPDAERESAIRKWREFAKRDR